MQPRLDDNVSHASDYAALLAYDPPSDRLLWTFLVALAENLDRAGATEELLAAIAARNSSERRTRASAVVAWIREAARDPNRLAQRPFLIAALLALAAGQAAVMAERRHAGGQDAGYDEIDLGGAVARAATVLEAEVDLQQEEIESLYEIQNLLQMSAPAMNVYSFGVGLLELLQAHSRKARIANARRIRARTEVARPSGGDHANALLALSGRSAVVPAIEVICPEIAALLETGLRQVQRWSNKENFPPPLRVRPGSKASVYSLEAVLQWYADDKGLSKDKTGQATAAVKRRMWEILGERGSEPVLAEVDRQIQAMRMRVAQGQSVVIVRSTDRESDDQDSRASDENDGNDIE